MVITPFSDLNPGTEYTVGTGIGYAFSTTPIHIGDTFTLDIRGRKCLRLGGVAV